MSDVAVSNVAVSDMAACDVAVSYMAASDADRQTGRQKDNKHRLWRRLMWQYLTWQHVTWQVVSAIVGVVKGLVWLNLGIMYSFTELRSNFHKASGQFFAHVISSSGAKKINRCGAISTAIHIRNTNLMVEYVKINK